MWKTGAHFSRQKEHVAFKMTMLSDEKFKITIYCLGAMNSSGNRSENTSKLMLPS